MEEQCATEVALGSRWDLGAPLRRGHIQVGLATEDSVGAQQQEQARRPPALAAMHTEQLSAAGAVGAADRTQSGPERRDRTRPLCCQEACRTFFTAGDRRDGGGAGRVVAFGRVREWLGRRAGVLGCKPVALATESFPICPPGPDSVVRPVTARAAACTGGD